MSCAQIFAMNNNDDKNISLQLDVKIALSIIFLSQVQAIFVANINKFL